MAPVDIVFLALMAAPDKAPSRLPLGKDTTYIVEPLDKEGYLDYLASLNERLGKDITPDKNVNVLLWKAIGPQPQRGRDVPAEFFKRLGIERPPKRGDYFIDLDSYLRKKLDRLDLEIWSKIAVQRTWASQRPWKTEDYPEVTAWLKANERPLALVLEATRRPKFFTPLVCQTTDKEPKLLIGVFPFGTPIFREMAAALAARAMLRVNEGKFDEAWQDLLACHRLGRFLTHSGTLMEWLSGLSIDQLVYTAELAYFERAKLSAQQVRDHWKALQNLPPIQPLADLIDVGQRFVYLDSVQFIHRGGRVPLDALNVFDAGGGFKKLDPEDLKALAVFDWENILREGNRWYDRLVTALRMKDPAARDKELAKIEDELKARKEDMTNRAAVLEAVKAGKDPGPALSKAIGDTLIGLSAPAIRRLQHAHDRSEQWHRNLQLAFALAAYQRDHGRYPAKLDELAPKYLAVIPRDLFSGKAMIYRPAPNGYLLYSVGVNGEDDGGRGYDDPPGDDLVVRMPLPALKKN
ncbi:MAG: hypothetical protein NZO58_13785 [Gemmataceae bacterium]|nr:hypothetical protein [Gemmataceae bacterium]